MKKLLVICLLAGMGACMCPKASTAPTEKKMTKKVATKATPTVAAKHKTVRSAKTIKATAPVRKKAYRKTQV